MPGTFFYDNMDQWHGGTNIRAAVRRALQRSKFADGAWKSHQKAKNAWLRKSDQTKSRFRTHPNRTRKNKRKITGFFNSKGVRPKRK